MQTLRLRITPDIDTDEIDGELVLTRPQASRSFILNGAGLALWRGLEIVETRAGAIELVQEAFPEQDPTVIATRVGELIDALIAAGFLSEEVPPPAVSATAQSRPRSEPAVERSASALPGPRFLTVPNFFPAADQLRLEFDALFSDPYGKGVALRIWNYWFVPDTYCYLKTDPRRVFSPSLIDRFVADLSAWASKTLGLAHAEQPTLSLYVNGCGQGLHNDAANGRFGYVFSLTNWANRSFQGGETLLFRDEYNCHRPGVASAGAGSAFYELVPALFNQLLVFDDRLIHAVPHIQGSMDPRLGRIVLHGHLTEGGILAEGAIDVEEVRRALDPAVSRLVSSLPGLGDYRGLFSARLRFQSNGAPSDVAVLCDRLLPVQTPAADRSAVVDGILEGMRGLRLRPSAGVTDVTIPIALS